MEDKSHIKEMFKGIGITLSEQQTEQFYRYYQLLIEKNKVVNLTAITEFEEVVKKHFIDSLMMFYEILNEEPTGSLIDVGTGAGFPGIPIKIVYPWLKVVLLDSLNKRVLFLKEVIEKLHLEQITAIHGRAEDLARIAEYREQFHYCVSRAVANLSSLSEYCIPFVKIGGCFLAYKSGKIEDELNHAEKAVTILGGKIEKRKDFLLPESDISRCLLLIRKIKHTPGKYPRKAGVPAKEPIF